MEKATTLYISTEQTNFIVPSYIIELRKLLTVD